MLCLNRGASPLYPRCTLQLFSFSLTCLPSLLFIFFFNDTATTEIYTLSLHDALPICGFLLVAHETQRPLRVLEIGTSAGLNLRSEEHTSELQSEWISYAVFCLKKKKKINLYVQMIRITHIILQNQISAVAHCFYTNAA